MAGWTNRGKTRLLEAFFRSQWNGNSLPTNLYVVLLSAAPDQDDNTMADLTEITGSGYTSGGFQLSRNTTDFDTLTEDDTNDKGKIYIKNVYWTASGGSIPTSGNATHAALTDDHATVANREVIAYWDITDSSVADGAILQLEDLELDLNES